MKQLKVVGKKERKAGERGGSVIPPAMMLLCKRTTAFGVAIEPEVYIIQAISSGDGASFAATGFDIPSDNNVS